MIIINELILSNPNIFTQEQVLVYFRILAQHVVTTNGNDVVRTSVGSLSATASASRSPQLYRYPNFTDFATTLHHTSSITCQVAVAHTDVCLQVLPAFLKH